MKIYDLIDPEWCANNNFDAAVALVYDYRDREIILVERREVEGDPWSGHIALPGGRREISDLNSYTTSLRELVEEISIDVRKILHVGGMKIYITRKSVRVVPHIYLFLSDDKSIYWNESEIKVAKWVSIEDLVEIECPNNYTPRCFKTSYFNKIVWGLTGRIIGDFIDMMRHERSER
ncbi:MAG: NUDIX domain-containing protein [Sulfolobales archaeon]